ncbi:glucose-6-phosphate isomerase [Leucobacter sp. HY1908]
MTAQPLAEVHVRIADHLAAAPVFRDALAALVRDQVASRTFALDATLWGEAAQPEAQVRLGWTNVDAAAAELLPRIAALRAEFAAQGVDRFVLCGMGGSSLGPAVIAQWAGVELTMLDSTDPAAVARTLAGDLARTAVIVSSKSGSTIETRSHLDTFEQAFEAAGIEPGSRLVIVTDPGSPFEGESRDAGRHVFLADPNVGGRFSVLTAFGLVPAGLAGADVAGLVREADAVRTLLGKDSPANPALQLAAAMFAGLPARFVLALDEAPSARWGLGRWAEQLVAESTGKEGLGVLPIALPSDAPEFAAVPPCVVTARVAGPGAEAAEAAATTETAEAGSGARDLTVSGALGAQFLAWELATAALGRLMGIDPFNQPDVESAKVAARAALAEAESVAADDASAAAATRITASKGNTTVLAKPAGATVETAADIVCTLRAMTPAGGYLAVQCYVDPQGALRAPLELLRTRLATALGVPVSLGYGPSYLHSVGQLHKGGPTLGAFWQLTDPGSEDLAIAGAESSFGTLLSAQARGDRGVLIERGRPVLALALAPGDASVIEQVIELLA